MNKYIIFIGLCCYCMASCIKDYSEKKNDGEKVYSVSLAKLEEMEGRLKSGYTSFWS